MFWEYYTLKVDAKGFFGGKLDEDSFTEQLDELGAEGWELVSMVTSNVGYGTTGYFICVFKREIDDEDYDDDEDLDDDE